MLNARRPSAAVDGRLLPVAFSVPIASVLSGASVDQLAYWRKQTASAAPLLVPGTKRSGRYLYSWADVVALRSIVYLRQEKSLPRIRRAVGLLRAVEADEWEHLARYTLISTKASILVRTPSGELLDLEHQPATVVSEVLMRDVLAAFTTRDGRDVPALENPRRLLTVNPRVLAGYPVIAGTRVPFDIVAGLAEDGVPAAEIVEMYPSVDPASVADARAFAEQVAKAA
jgi:uncharacterized protein (DUF433 family)/DNA-binding transcriptional MerR regulator